MNTHYEFRICQDCMLFFANGDIPESRPDLAEDIKSRMLKHFPKYPEALRQLVLGDTENAPLWSNACCFTCGSCLVGDRYPAAILCDHPECRSDEQVQRDEEAAEAAAFTDQLDDVVSDDLFSFEASGEPLRAPKWSFFIQGLKRDLSTYFQDALPDDCGDIIVDSPAQTVSTAEEVFDVLKDRINQYKEAFDVRFLDMNLNQTVRVEDGESSYANPADFQRRLDVVAAVAPEQDDTYVFWASTTLPSGRGMSLGSVVARPDQDFEAVVSDDLFSFEGSAQDSWEPAISAIEYFAGDGTPKWEFGSLEAFWRHVKPDSVWLTAASDAPPERGQESQPAFSSSASLYDWLMDQGGLGYPFLIVRKGAIVPKASLWVALTLKPSEADESADFGSVVSDDLFSFEAQVSRLSASDLQAWADELISRLGLEALDVSLRGTTLALERLEVPRARRKQGIGTMVLRELEALADRYGLRVSSGSQQLSRRQRRFLRGFGFASNSGRKRDYTTSAQMIRPAAAAVPVEQAPELGMEETARMSRDPARTIIEASFVRTADSAGPLEEVLRVPGVSRLDKMYARRVDINDWLEPVADGSQREEHPFVGQLRFQDIPILVEQRAGDVRSGVDPSGRPWSVTLLVPYGEIPGVKGNDKDNLDVYVGPDKSSLKVFVAHQNHVHGEKAGDFDEDKVFLGFNSAAAVEAVFRAHMSLPGALRSVTSMSMEQFKDILKSGDMKGTKIARSARVHSAVRWRYSFRIRYSVQGAIPGFVQDVDSAQALFDCVQARVDLINAATEGKQLERFDIVTRRNVRIESAAALEDVLRKQQNQQPKPLYVEAHWNNGVVEEIASVTVTSTEEEDPTDFEGIASDDLFSFEARIAALTEQESSSIEYGWNSRTQLGQYHEHGLYHEDIPQDILEIIAAEEGITVADILVEGRDRPMLEAHIGWLKDSGGGGLPKYYLDVCEWYPEADRTVAKDLGPYADEDDAIEAAKVIFEQWKQDKRLSHKNFDDVVSDDLFSFEAAAPVYPITVTFERVFTKGALEGLTQRDAIGFSSRESAEAWLEGIEANEAKGELAYYIRDVGFRANTAEPEPNFSEAVSDDLFSFDASVVDNDSSLRYSTSVNLRQALESLRPRLADAAQQIIDAWEVDSEDGDDEYGGGGCCDAIAQEMWGIIAELDVSIREGGHDGDDHAWLIVWNETEAFGVDIPPDVYERGGGYSWTKIPGAKVRPEDVQIWPIELTLARDGSEHEAAEHEASADSRVAQVKAAPAAPAPPARQLVALHNLTAGNLLHAAEVGGLIAPSLAVTRADLPFTNFGDITLIAPLSLVDPAKTPVFDADVYSPRYPQVHHDPSKDVWKWLKEYRPYTDRTGTYLSDIEYIISDKGQEDMKRRSLPALQLGFLERVKGMTVEDVLEAIPLRYEWITAPALQDFFRTHGVDHNADSSSDYWKLFAAAVNTAIEQHYSSDAYKIYNQAADEHFAPDEIDRFDFIKAAKERVFSNGELNFGPGDTILREAKNVGKTQVNRRGIEAKLEELIKPFQAEFDAWADKEVARVFGKKYLLTPGGKRMKYTPENVLKRMTRTVKGGEGFDYGLGSARAKGAHKFRSLDQMQAASDRLVSDAEMEEHKKELNAEFDALADELAPYHPASGSFGYMDAVKSAVESVYKRGKPLWSEMRADGFTTVPPEYMAHVYDFAKKLVNAPTEYFEAKPQRIVALQEFEAAVVPDDSAPAVFEVLKRHGLEVLQYPKDESAARAAAVQSFANRSSSGRTAGSWGDYVRGEWWLMPDGDEVACDGDVGDLNHEIVAMDDFAAKYEEQIRQAAPRQLWHSHTAAFSLVEQAVDRLSGSDAALRGQLEAAARRLSSETEDEDEIVARLQEEVRRGRVREQPPETPGAELVDSNPMYWIYDIKTPEAARRFADRQWCIGRTIEAFSQHVKAGAHLLYYVPRTGLPAKYAVLITEEGGQMQSRIWDSDDTVVFVPRPELKRNVLNEFPTSFEVYLAEALSGDQAAKNGLDRLVGSPEVAEYIWELTQQKRVSIADLARLRLPELSAPVVPSDSLPVRRLKRITQQPKYAAAEAADKTADVIHPLPTGLPGGPAPRAPEPGFGPPEDPMDRFEYTGLPPDTFWGAEDNPEPGWSGEISRIDLPEQLEGPYERPGPM